MLPSVTGWIIRNPFLAETGILFLYHHIQMGFEVLSLSQWVPRALSVNINRLE
jgi:hypothetical protein